MAHIPKVRNMRRRILKRVRNSHRLLKFIASTAERNVSTEDEIFGTDSSGSAQEAENIPNGA